MGRAPCCEKMGLKKGPWTPEEDQILINYINNHGHANWRALPKQAGLFRCGKSCRLRWTNYLRPDIKRGNFTREEEDTIIDLHEILGNRWSAIAARLPGRTDNEIKNVWHTHLKKRLLLPQNQQSHDRKRNPKPMTMELDSTSNSKSNQHAKQEQPDPVSFPSHVAIKAETESTEDGPLLSSPRHCSSDMSTVTTSTADNNEHNSSIITNTNDNHDMYINNNDNNNNVESPENNYDLALDEDFWSEVLSADNSGKTGDFPAIRADHHQQFQFPFSPPAVTEEGAHLATSTTSSMRDDSMDFWYEVYTRSEEYLIELLKL